jgi:uncharacterized membrane protein
MCAPARKLQGHTALPAEVNAVLDAKCHACHSDPPRNYAPMPITTWEQVQDFAPTHTDGPAIYELIGKRIHDDKFPMPPIRQPQLTDEERATLDAWIAQCAPPGP